MLLDIGNAVDEHMELIYPTASLGEQLQQVLAGTKVVKSLNTLPGTLAVAPDSLPAPTVVFLSGDDADAKTLVSDLTGDLGWAEESRIDLGGIAAARAAERYVSMFGALMGYFRGAPFNLALVHWVASAPSVPPPRGIQEKSRDSGRTRGIRTAFREKA